MGRSNPIPRTPRVGHRACHGTSVRRPPPKLSFTAACRARPATSYVVGPDAACPAALIGAASNRRWRRKQGADHFLHPLRPADPLGATRDTLSRPSARTLCGSTREHPEFAYGCTLPLSTQIGLLAKAATLGGNETLETHRDILQCGPSRVLERKFGLRCPSSPTAGENVTQLRNPLA